MGDANGFIKGALVGGLVAGTAGLLLAPKPGAKLVEDILDAYDSAQKNSRDFVETVKKKGACLSHCWEDEECNGDHSSLLMGAAIGAVIAGIAALLLAPDSGKKIRKLLGDQYSDIVEKAEGFASTVGSKGKQVIDEVWSWEETLAELIRKLSQGITAKGKRSRSDTKIEDILDLAQLGIRFYQQMNSRR